MPRCDRKLLLISIIIWRTTVIVSIKSFQKSIRENQKLLRKKSIGTAIRQLRTKLDWTQFSLAVALKVEPGMVSRWERGNLSPHRLYLERIKKLAKKNGLDQLVQILNDPIQNWKAAIAMNSPEKAELITRLEIAAINGSMGEDEDSDDDNLRYTLAHIEKKMVSRYNAGEEFMFFANEQREAWQKILAQHSASSPGRGRRRR